MLGNKEFWVAFIHGPLDRNRERMSISPLLYPSRLPVQMSGTWFQTRDSLLSRSPLLVYCELILGSVRSNPYAVYA
jgi:hypothetical protein